VFRETGRKFVEGLLRAISDDPQCVRKTIPGNCVYHYCLNFNLRMVGSGQNLLCGRFLQAELNQAVSVVAVVRQLDEPDLSVSMLLGQRKKTT